MTAIDAKRRRLTAQARRAEILDTATRLLSERGFNGVTIQEVADAAGMAKSGVLHHFPSKDALLVALLEFRDEQDMTRYRIDALPSLDRDSARQLVDTVVTHNFERREVMRLFTVLSAEALDVSHPAHDYFRDRLSSTRRLIGEVATHLHPDPESASLRIIAFMDGLQLLWLRDESVPALKLWADFADRLFAE